jgi:hypothetical protein
MSLTNLENLFTSYSIPITFHSPCSFKRQKKWIKRWNYFLKFTELENDRSLVNNIPASENHISSKLKIINATFFNYSILIKIKPLRQELYKNLTEEDAILCRNMLFKPHCVLQSPCSNVLNSFSLWNVLQRQT